jgi:hypothetical protein
MAYTTIDDPSAYFHTQLYTGDGASTNAITNDANAGDFQPDWIWIKRRDGADNHHVFDTSRGITKELNTNGTGAEGSGTNLVKSSDTDGFTLGDNGGVNGSSETYVAWQWKANGGTTTTNDASSTGVGSLDSVYQANTTAGFSIITYTGTGSNATIAHGLGSAPTMLIVKNRSSAESWMVGHHKNSNGFQSSVFLDLTAAKDTDAVYFNNTAPTSTVISIGTNTKINHASENHVMYAFAEIQGYSKFGSYTGNGNVDGPFVYTGFSPAWVIVKRFDSGNNWHLHDNKRVPYNSNNKTLYPNLDNVEQTEDFDMLSNGFKLRESGGGYNASGGTYIYMAFAESPFVSSEGVPTTAR